MMARQRVLDKVFGSKEQSSKAFADPMMFL
jgi:hypothetical protein